MATLELVDCVDTDELHVCDPCDPGEGDGVRSVFFYKEGAFATATPTALEFENGQIASPQTVKVIPTTRGTYDGGTPTYGEGFGDADSSYESASHKLSYVDPNYLNRDFYDWLQNQTQWMFGWRTETKIHLTNKPVTAYAKDVHSGDIKKKLRWEVEITWTSKNKPTIAAIPADTFVCTVVTP